MSPGGADWAAEAVRAWDALWLDATRPRRWGRGRAVRDGPGAGPAALWPLSQVVTAALDVALVTGDPSPAMQLIDEMERYRTPGGYVPFPGSAELYYDDNAWVGLALVQAHHQLGDDALLARAVAALGAVAAGEHPDGGVRWRRAPASPRNTCATAPAAELALVVHAARGGAELLGFAARCRAFLELHLRGSDGLYADHVDADGVVEPTRWSYNQGTALGAHVLWWRATGDADALARAEETLAAAEPAFGAEHGWPQPAAFQAVYHRSALLVPGAPGIRARASLERYAVRTLVAPDAPRPGWHLGGSIGRYDGAGTIDQAGLVQLYALLALAPEARAHIV